MCAKDRSHIAVRSQTDSIHSMREMLNISSCPAFIRDSRGEVIHTSPTFDKIFLTSGGTGAFDTPRAPEKLFLDLSPGDQTGTDAVRTEIVFRRFCCTC